MHTNSYPDLNKLCRLCLGELMDECEFYIFNPEFSIPLRIMACTTLEVKESDNLPSLICKLCRIQLEKFYLFRKKCQNSDIKLRKHIRKVITGKVSTVFCKTNDDDELDSYDEDYINSQQFVAAFEIEEQMIQQKIKEELVKCHKYTQTTLLDVETNLSHDNINQENLAQGFIISNNNSLNSQNNSDIKQKSNPHQEKENENNDIIYVVENECSEAEYESTQEVQVYIEDEEFYLKNCSGEPKPENIEENEDSTSFIDDTSILLDEEENLNKMFDVNTNGNEIVKTELQKESSEHNEHKEDKRDRVFENKDIKLFKCHICPQSFSRIFLLDKHLHLHKKSKNYICGICKKHFAAKSSLHRHLRIHNGEKPYQCDFCGKSFVQSGVLKRHRYLHLDKKPFECALCDQAFIQKSLLQQHIAIKHSKNPCPKLYNCDICPKTFMHSSGLSRHLILHSGISYDCEHCKKKFTDKSALKRHTEIHSRMSL